MQGADSSADLLRGGTGDDVLQGGTGNDAYLYSCGDGSDTISDGGDDDRLVFGPGIVPSDVTVSRIGYDLRLDVGADGQGVTVLNHFHPWYSAQVEHILFADGTEWTWRDVAAAVGLTVDPDPYQGATVTGTSGSETLNGTSGNDIIDGGAGDDVLRSGGGADTYVFGRGYAHDTIDDQDFWNADRVLFKADVLPSDVILTQVAISGSSQADLLIGIQGSSDTLMVKGTLDSNGGVGRYAFADGTVWIQADIKQRLVAQAETTGDDTVVGFSGNGFAGFEDTLDGSMGNDLLQGGNGADTYIFGRGYGQDTIDDQGYFGTDRVLFRAGILPGDLALTRVATSGSAQNDVLITIRGTGDALLIREGMDPAWGVERYEFADGTIWAQADIKQRLIAQAETAGDDAVVGFSGTSLGGDGDDTLDGAAGDDVLRGSNGADTYVFGGGYGQDTIDDDGYFGTDRILFRPGVRPADIGLSKPGALGSGSSDMLVTVQGAAGDTLLLKNQLSRNYGIDQVAFADGTIWSRDELAQRFVTQQTSAGADDIIGTGGGDTFDGGAGNDVLHGNGGNDTYVFGRGYGQDTVDDGYDYGSGDTVLFRADTQPGDVVLTPSAATGPGVGDLLISIRGTTDTLLIKHGLDSWYGTGPLRFTDGTVWSSADIRSRVITGQETVGDDTVVGFSGANFLDARGGTDVVQGLGGGDTFFFGQGYGQLRINEVDSSWTPSNTVMLGLGITPPQVAVSIDAQGGGVLKIGTGGTDRIIIDRQFSTDWNAAQLGIQAVQFADGTTWSRQDLRDRSTTGTAGGDTFYGTSAAEIFDGKGGSDYVEGRGGNDTVLFNAGYGQLEIKESDTAYNPSNVLRFGAGIAASQVVISSSGADVLLIAGSADRVKLDGMASSASAGVQRVEFADGTSWSRADIIAHVPITGTPGNDSLNGTASADVFDGLGGNDYVQGRGGGDTFLFNQGYGRLEVEEADYAYSPNNVLRLGPGILPGQVSLTGNGDNWAMTATIGANGDAVVLDGQLLYSSSGVQQIRFSDGAIWDRAEITRQNGLGQPGKPVLFGSSGDDTFDPRGYAHEIWSRGGSDTYLMDRGHGEVAIHNSSWSTSSPHGHLAFSEAVAPDQLWLVQSGGDLVATILGTEDRAVMKDWFSNAAGPTSDIQAAGGAKLDSSLGQLVSSMASYQAANPGFSPGAASAMPSDPTLQASIAAAWHH